MNHKGLINGFQYLIMLSLARGGSVGAAQVLSDVEQATGETFSQGGVSSTLNTLIKNQVVTRERKRASGRTGKGSHSIYHFELTAAGADRLAAMNRAVKALWPAPESETPGN